MYVNSLAHLMIIILQLCRSLCKETSPLSCYKRLTMPLKHLSNVSVFFSANSYEYEPAQRDTNRLFPTNSFLFFPLFLVRYVVFLSRNSYEKLQKLSLMNMISCALNSCGWIYFAYTKSSKNRADIQCCSVIFSVWFVGKCTKSTDSNVFSLIYLITTFISLALDAFYDFQCVGSMNLELRLFCL